MGQFSNSFPKHFSYLCEYAVRFDLSCGFCEYPFIFHCLQCSPSCFDPDSLLLAYLWLGLSWIDCISANKSFSSSKTSSRKPYTSSKQQERHKHSVEITINFSVGSGIFCDSGTSRPLGIQFCFGVICCCLLLLLFVTFCFSIFCLAVSHKTDPQAFCLHEGKLFMAKREVVNRGWLSDAQSSEKRLHRKKQNGPTLYNVDTMPARLLEVLAATKGQALEICGQACQAS